MVGSAFFIKLRREQLWETMHLQEVSANFLNNFFGKPQKSLILRAFSGFPNF